MMNIRIYHKVNRTKIWHAIRIAKVISIPEIRTLSGVDAKQIQTYTGHLARAGILCKTTNKRPITYRLVKNLGMHAPQISTKHNGIIDPNSGDIIKW